MGEMKVKISKDTYRSCFRYFVVLMLLSAPVTLVWAQQDYPTRTVRLIVPSSPGGGTDTTARIISSKLGEGLGQPVVIDFRAGAGTTLATELTAKAPPDGYTILLSASTTMAINATLYSKLPYDTVKDLAAVTMIAAIPNILVAHPAVPANTVQELIALAKTKPGSLSFATPGSGTTPHLSTELFKNLAGIQMTHIPYKGAGPAMVDVVGGHVQLLMDNIPSVQTNVSGGRLKVIGVTSAKRSGAMPNAPTFAESGLPGFEANSWWALLVPAATPGVWPASPTAPTSAARACTRHSHPAQSHATTPCSRCCRAPRPARNSSAWAPSRHPARRKRQTRISAAKSPSGRRS